MPVYNDHNERVENGYLHESYSLAQMGEKAPGLAAKQIALLQKELSLYPGNYEATLRLLTLQMNQATGGCR